MEIRQKLRVAIGGLLLILFLAGGTAIWVISRSNLAIEALFKNNYNSVVYMHQLTESLEKINNYEQDSLAHDSVRNEKQVSQEQTNLEENLQNESHNITEPGEQQLADSLLMTWKQSKVETSRFFKIQGDLARKKLFYDQRLAPQYQSIKSLAWQIADLNLKNVSRYRGRGSQLAATADRWMGFLLFLGMLLSVLMMVVLGRAVLRPIQQLMVSAKEIEKGNLDLLLNVESKDELGHLAMAFNAMAGRLREFRRSDRAKLLRVQKTTQMAINSFSDPVAVLNAAGEIELCNRAAENLFGLKSGSYLSHGTLKHLEKFVPEILATSHAYEPRGYSEAIQVFQLGKEKFVLPRLLPVLDDQGRAVGVTLVLVDVTGLRKMDEMKTDLLSTVSHELKTPLTTLRMATHLLLEKSLGPLTLAQEGMLSTARDDSDRLHAILEDLLDLSRLQAGKNLLQLRSQAAGKLMEGAVELLGMDLKNKNLKLELVVEPALQEVAIDPQRIGHVFSNLFGNAIKYSPIGGLIRAGAKVSEGHVLFWIQDGGPGISEAYKNRIFERFFRVPEQQGVQGAGLGLAIAKEIVEMHGGQIMVDSQMGRGATFSFELPLWNAEPDLPEPGVSA